MRVRFNKYWNLFTNKCSICIYYKTYTTDFNGFVWLFGNFRLELIAIIILLL